MDAEYDERVACQLIESVEPKQMFILLTFDEWNMLIDNADKQESRCRSLTGVILALAGVVAFMGFSR